MPSVTRYKRSPWASIRGFAQFKRNMQQLVKLGDQQVLINGFTDIAREIRFDMNTKLRTILKPPTQKYLRAKKNKALGLRQRGVVAKPFSTKGKSKSFVGINYKFAPHAHLIEFGTAPRYTKAFKSAKTLRAVRSAYRGKGPKKAFFRPVVSNWRRSGLYVQRVERVVDKSLQTMTRGMTV